VQSFLGRKIVGTDIKEYKIDGIEIFRETYFNNYIHRGNHNNII